MKQHNRDEMARAWLVIQQNWWAYDALDKLTDESPHEAWAVVLRLIELSESETLLEDIGSGPLEDLMQEHAPSLIEEVEARAEWDKRFRKALSCVCIPEGESKIAKRL